MCWPWNRNKELNEELEAHFRMVVQDRVAAGASEQEALAAARREFGNVGLVKEVTRDMWGWTFAENFFRDIRYSLRQLRKSPGFTITVVLTLALGIGGTTAIFSLIDSVMLRSLPVADPGSLYRIGDSSVCCVTEGPTGRWGIYPYSLFKRLKAAAPEFEQMAAFQAMPGQFSVRLTDAGRISQALIGEYVTGNYFSTFGIRPFAGRLFSPGDDSPSATPVAVLSYRAWRGLYGSDVSVIGSTLVVNNHPFTIIGIAPPAFFGDTLRSDPPEFWLPLHQEPLIAGQSAFLKNESLSWLRIIGRLQPGATVAGLSARLTGVLRQWMKTESGYSAASMKQIGGQTIEIVPAGSGVGAMQGKYGHDLHILFAACGLVLLIACANVANLLLARGMARRGDTALRLAMGASARRLVSQALTESVFLAIAGGITGLAVAYGAGRLLLALAFQSAHFIPIGAAPSLPVLAFAFGLSVATGIVFGTAPAWFATHTNPMDALRGAHRSMGRQSSFSRNALLTVQATLSMVLVAGAAMLAQSLTNLEDQNWGFQTTNRIAVELSPLPATYKPQQLNALYRNLEDRLDRLPGVKNSGLALYNPLAGDWSSGIFVAGRSDHASTENVDVLLDLVSAGYLHSLGIPIVRGRGLSKQDTAMSAPVAVVNQAFVRTFLPNENPIGKYFNRGRSASAKRYRIVGVARNSKFAQPRAADQPMYFLSLAQYLHYNAPGTMEMRSHLIGSILLNTHLSPGALEPVLKKTLAEVDPNLTILSIRAMQQQIALQFNQERAVASLAGLFGIVALILAAVGLYGVMAYSVTQRTSEIGVRMALGADRANVVRMVLRGAFKRAAVGLLLGIPLAVGAGRLLSSQLYGVSAWDPLALAVAIGSLALCALLAAVIPARRAASIEPMNALRIE